jgi:hypothetical protein
MSDYVAHNNLISSFQSGFQPSHSTMSAFVRFFDGIRLNLELNQSTILVLQTYYSRPRNMLSECIREVNSDLRKIFEWYPTNLLRLNPAKSMVLRQSTREIY